MIRADNKCLGKMEKNKCTCCYQGQKKTYTVGGELVHGKNERMIGWIYMNQELEKEGAEHIERMKKRKKNRGRNEEKRR